MLGGKVAHAADVERLGVVGSRKRDERVPSGPDHRVDRGVAGGMDLGEPCERVADEVRVERRAGGGDPSFVGVVVELQHLLLDRAIREHGHEQHDLGLEWDELHAAHQRGVDVRSHHHRGVPAHPAEELARLVEEVFERLVCRREEIDDGAALRRGELAFAREVVDEVAVAAVGGDAPGRRVRLHEVPVTFEDGHLVADRGARHTEPAGARDRLRPDRLRRLDVLLDDGSQDRGFTLVERFVRRRIQGVVHLALNPTECQRPWLRRCGPGAVR